MEHQGFDLATFEDRAVPSSILPTYRVPKSQTFLDFRSQIALDYGYEAEDVRLWVLVNRQNKTVRPDAPVSDQDPSLSAFSFLSCPLKGVKRVKKLIGLME